MPHSEESSTARRARRKRNAKPASNPDIDLVTAAGRAQRERLSNVDEYPLAPGELRSIKVQDVKYGMQLHADAFSERKTRVTQVQHWQKGSVAGDKYRHSSSCRGVHINGTGCYDYGATVWVSL